MAFGAVRAACAIMRIVLFMAGNARHPRFRHAVVCAMASGTGHRAMRAGQVEARHYIMVKLRPRPCRAGVATGAVGPARTNVFVILGMATDAGPT